MNEYKVDADFEALEWPSELEAGPPRCPHPIECWDRGADGDVRCNVCGVLLCEVCRTLHGRHPDGRWRQFCACPSGGSASRT